MTDSLVEQLATVSSDEERATAQANAKFMTGEEPKFKNPTERHRTVMENGIVTLIRYMQASYLLLDQMQNDIAAIRKTVTRGDDGE